ncbi:hypothetical protein AB0G32_40260, partial [Streptomyces sp. NPDC023723]|uniref:hypothetical protein n=1 Tax=Streptomyces sp. NPDC023723 TaxID=3154323 RepID=UPI0033C6B1D6
MPPTNPPYSPRPVDRAGTVAAAAAAASADRPDLARDPGLRQAVEAVAGLPARWTPVAEHTARGLWRLPRA